MTFNEFTQRLESCHLDEGTKYLLSHIFEVQIEINRQLDIQAGLLAAVVNSMQGVVTLHESTQDKVNKMMQRDQFPGVSVRSEPND